MARSDGRESDQIRNTKIQNDVQAFAEGSALITTGDTQVLCAVSVEEGVPRFLKGTGQGFQDLHLRVLVGRYPSLKDVPRKYRG